MKRLFAASMVLMVFSIVGLSQETTQVVKESSLIDPLYHLQRLPQLRPGTVTNLFSSYDRTGGNNDGFSGAFSKLRLEGGNSVLAEMKGPGCIQRIWFTHSDGQFGLLARKGEHIRIYIDGQSEPVLDYPLEDIFAGKHEAFPKPLVGEGLGGFYCYVPIPYQKECKVVVDGDNVRFYQITYQTFPSNRRIENFSPHVTEEKKQALNNAVRAWNNCGNLSLFGANNLEALRVDLQMKPGEIKRIPLPDGPHLVRAVKFSGSEEQLKRAGGSFMTFHWDGAQKPAVAAPLEYFFMTASQAIPLKSLLVGRTEQGLYNYMPMPYLTSGVLTLHALQIPEGLSGTVEVWTEKLPDNYGQFGYFRTYFHTEIPPTPGEYFTFLKREGRGHFIGMFMDTDGHHPAKLPNWMEGDDRWFTDGEFRGQGTGSEDYFNCGWYALEGRLNRPGAFPLHGFPVYRYEESNGKSWCSAYRWHVTDPVSYEESILVDMEHGEVNNYLANYRGIAFYYDVQP